MSFDQEATAIRQLRTENLRLKQRVFELEEKARTASSAPVATSTGSTSVLKLIEHKDFQLQQYAARLEEKKEQLEEAARELEQGKFLVRLCQEMLDQDPSALIGVGRDGRILLFNRGALNLIGERLQGALNQPLGSVEPDLARNAQEALAGGKPVESPVVLRDRRVLATLQPVGKGADSRGVLIRIQGVSAK